MVFSKHCCILDFTKPGMAIYLGSSLLVYLTKQAYLISCSVLIFMTKQTAVLLSWKVVKLLLCSSEIKKA